MSQTMTSVELLASIGAQWYEQLLILMEIHTKHSQCCTQSRVSPHHNPNIGFTCRFSARIPILGLQSMK